MKKNRYKVVFLMLHFNESKITINSVNCLFRQMSFDDCHIVIVDNGSTDNSGSILDKAYEHDENITILHNNKNLGFSNGNNIGYTYIKMHFITDFIVCMNNDILIKQLDFVDTIYRIYDYSPFYVCGPDEFILSDMKHNNPMRLTISTKEIVLDRIKQFENSRAKYEEKNIAWCYKKYLKYKYQGLFPVRIIVRLNSILKGLDSPWKNNIDNCVLHGACLIFDKRFIFQNEVLFEPLTFLYCEEEVLAIKCKKNNWNTCYSSELKVIHIGGASSGIRSIDFISFCKKKISNIEQRIAAEKALLDIII